MPKSFAEVLERNLCRYIEGEGAARVFCAHARQEGKSYCVAHSKICFTGKKMRLPKIILDQFEKESIYEKTRSGLRFGRASGVRFVSKADRAFSGRLASADRRGDWR